MGKKKTSETEVFIHINHNVKKAVQKSKVMMRKSCKASLKVSHKSVGEMIVRQFWTLLDLNKMSVKAIDRSKKWAHIFRHLSLGTKFGSSVIFSLSKNLVLFTNGLSYAYSVLKFQNSTLKTMFANKWRSYMVIRNFNV